MTATVAVFVGVLLCFGVYSAHTRSQVQVGGPYYNQILLSKDLVADILPPPAYILEAFLITYQAANAADPKERDELLTRLGENEKEFHDRQKYWKDSLAESRMKTALIADSAKHAEAFFTIVRDRYLPAIKAGRTDEVRQLTTHEMRDAYPA